MEFLRHTVAKNYMMISADFADFSTSSSSIPVEQLYGLVRRQALVVSMKEIYGWLIIVASVSLMAILVSYGPVRPFAIFPKWERIRKIFRRETHLQLQHDVK